MLPWRRALPASVVSGLALALADASLALVRAPSRLPGALPRLRFVAELAAVLSLSSLLAVALALGLAAVAATLPPRARLFARAALGTLFGYGLGLALFSGTGMQRSPLRPWLIALATALGLLLSPVAAWVWARRERVSPRALGALAAVAATGLYAGHALVLPRLYPALHALAAVAAWGLATTAVMVWTPRARGRVALAVAGVVVALGALGSASIARKQSHRVLARQGAPFARYPVEWIGRFGPSAPAVRASGEAVVLRGPHLPLLGRDLVLVTIDALRADRLRANGGRGRMPALDAMAARGVLFRRAYCTTPHTSYSVASLMLGKYARSVMALPGAMRPQETLAGWLGALGYQTAGFFPPAVFAVDGERFGDLSRRGFDFTTREVTYATAAERVRSVERYLAARAPHDRVFVWVHLFEPHEPYEPHPEHPYGTGRLERYDAEASAADDAIAALQQTFAAHGRRPAWIVTADHGEEFGEHGGSFHGTSLYDEQVRVPLVMEADGLGPRVIDAPVSLVDVAPTVLAGIGAVRPARLRGSDLGPLVFDPTLNTRAYAATGTLRMVVDRAHKLIVDLSDGTTELYDLARDPSETHNLADFDTELAHTLRGEITWWEASHARQEAQGAPVTSETAAWLPDALQRAIQGDVSMAPEVAGMLRAGGFSVRRRAAHVLGDLGVRDAAVRDALAAELTATDAALVREAGLSLALLGDARGRGTARAVMDAADEGDARRAAMGLGRLGDRAAVPVLARWMTDAREVDAVRDEVVRLLLHLRDARALDAWVTLLADLRLAPLAARALGELGDPRAIAPIETSLATMVYPLTIRAEVEALVALGAPDAWERVMAALDGRDPLPDAFRLLRRVREPGVRLAGAVGMSLALGSSVRAVRLAGGGGQRFRRVYVSATSDGPRRITLVGTGASVELPGGEREVSVDLASPRSAVFLRLTSDGPAVLRGVFVR